jgi:hypothetical protein
VIVVFAMSLVPLFIWLWRAELVNLVADCIAEGIRRAQSTKAPNQ